MQFINDNDMSGIANINPFDENAKEPDSILNGLNQLEI